MSDMEKQIPISFTFLPRNPEFPDIPNIEVSEGGGVEGYGSRGGAHQVKPKTYNLFGYLLENGIHLRDLEAKSSISGSGVSKGVKIKKQPKEKVHSSEKVGHENYNVSTTPISVDIAENKAEAEIVKLFNRDDTL